jgi:hypothetical protein
VVLGFDKEKKRKKKKKKRNLQKILGSPSGASGWQGGRWRQNDADWRLAYRNGLHSYEQRPQSCR